ncbi:hypothetical protein B0I35DRAFT_68069 [Stachybotrys elegans]|uniref:Uncharacterized protein n=1 Tax=Stachybotrys elegans TaxID=80388 RepID=A0A8K0WNQ0_9HYPO|nr:hypothetical protein B0I35DRAFT_68069 [Stachybotrys elegans]
MNRFRTKKKVKEEGSAPRPSVESDTSSPFRMFGRKKSIEEEKKEIDLTTALPTNDDFRTSLLMTGLSARFSMLREQDDPTSKIGKASDDSVLYPKRQSRMADFGFSGGLHDIAEVESLRAPPFARADSFQSDDASINGSIMNRAKPTEGNALFGGRQKVYKIPAGSKSGLPGRALYDDDVAQSAFQKWRQAQRDAPSLDDDSLNDTVDSEPRMDFSRRRETNSTISSGPSAARNSTAATSITSSQPAPSIKDWQANSSTGPVPSVERSVTRTRRLYEQGLNQELQDQQTSALSRIDTLTRQRGLGSRTPDLSPNMPSPTTASIADRVLDWRPIMAKSSAPNLRSFTPPTSGSSQTTLPDLGIRFPSEQKGSFGAAPPLSPPISETGDQPGISPHSTDRLAGTSLFNRAPEQYDETKYAQRQRQLQKGRETPQGRSRGESNVSITTSRSASLSSAPGASFEKPEPVNVQKEPTVKEEEGAGLTFLDDDDAQSLPDSAPTVSAPQVTLARPDDHQHPALRYSTARMGDMDPATQSILVPAVRSPASSAASPTMGALPVDSPTLGPDTGLSGMVRQHLRNTSVASSFYGGADEADAAQEPLQPRRDTSYLELTEDDWDMAHGKVDASMGMASEGSKQAPAESVDTPRSSEEQDDFARHLADGARRVRERLTTYVETDSRPQSPGGGVSPDPKSPGLSLRTNALGIIKTKPSLGSLADRNRDNRELSVPKPNRALGLGAATMATSPVRRSFESKDETSPVQSPESQRGNQSPEGDGDESPGDQKENVHAGLKAFRQARRELQRMKELELQQRRPTQPSYAPPQPPISYNNRPPRAESRTENRSRSESRAASDRDRSGSDASNGGQGYARPPRLRTTDHQGLSVNVSGGNGRDGNTMRSPGLPGTDIRRSPIMPPHPYPGKDGPPRSPYGRTDTRGGLHVQPSGRPYDSGAPSPVSPHGGRMYPPNGAPPMGPYSPRGREMSEGSVSSLPDGGLMSDLDNPRLRLGGLAGPTSSTPNLHANGSAPPLPPINPRRRNGRTPFGSAGDDGSVASHSSDSRDRSPAPLYMSEDDGGLGSWRQRLRKVTSEVNVAAPRSRRGTGEQSSVPDI